MIPTDEQQAILRAVTKKSRGPLKIAAGPGTGKTALLCMAAASLQNVRPGKILYLAYNKSLAQEAKEKFRGLAEVRTIHSLAYEAMRVRQAHRTVVSRISPRVYAQILDIDSTSERAKAVDDVLKRFVQSEATEIALDHVQRSTKSGLDADTLTTDARDCFEALRPETSTRLPLSHDIYLKAWQVNGAPGLHDYPTVMLDEAQDASPIIIDALSRAAHAIYVGDEHQQIYAWLGAIDALTRINGPKFQLTQSFRFGPAIAAAANRILDLKHADPAFRLRGNSTLHSTIGSVDIDRDHTRIYWTNDALIDDFLFLHDIGRRPCFAVGDDFTSLLRAAWSLHTGVSRRVRHDYVRRFDNFADFRDAAKIRGGDAHYAAVLIDALQERTPEVIARLQSPPDGARTWQTTAHRSKGSEWPQVLISSDFDDLLDPDSAGAPSEQALNLVYVAITRAQNNLELQSTVLEDILA